MHKYYISERYEHALYTAGKARMDIEAILDGCGYEKLLIDKQAKTLMQKLKMYYAAFKTARRIKNPAIVYTHFPVLSRIIRLFLFYLRQRGIMTLTHTHDLEGIRDQDDEIFKKESRILRHFSAVITQNEAMEKLIQNTSHFKPIFLLHLYDYLIQENKYLKKRSLSNNIAFAGNPEKAPFINKIGNVKNLHFHLYGNNAGQTGRLLNITHYGKLHPDDLPFSIEGSFGLVWDGDSLETCQNNYGNYLRFNLPYKLSLYIAAGLPVITWNESAIAKWVLKENIGFTVSSITQVYDIIAGIKQEQYEEWLFNLTAIRQKIIKGAFFRNSLKEAEYFLIDKAAHHHSSSFKTARKAS